MEPVSVLGAVSSLTLIGLAVAISLRMRLGIERSIIWAALRAAVQLLAVGAVFRLIFESAQAPLYSGLWVAGMIEKVKVHFAGARINDADGVRVDTDEGWVHLRPSNTEPIVRLIAEGTDEATANALIDEAAGVAGLSGLS